MHLYSYHTNIILNVYCRIMSKLTYGYPPLPLSCYAEHSRFDYFYKREDRTPKRGQAWDLFNSWGQQRLLVNDCYIPYI